MVGWLLAGQGVTERDRTGQNRIGLGWFRCSMHCRVLLYLCGDGSRVMRSLVAESSVDGQVMSMASFLQILHSMSKPCMKI